MDFKLSVASDPECPAAPVRVDAAAEVDSWSPERREKARRDVEAVAERVKPRRAWRADPARQGAHAMARHMRPERDWALWLGALGDLDQIDDEGSVPLRVAIGSKCFEAAWLLMEAGADFNYGVGHPEGLTDAPILFDLSLTGHLAQAPRWVDFACALGAKMEERDTSGRTALIAATRHGAKELVKALIDAGAELWHRDHMGNTALHHAVQNRNETLVALLLADPSPGARLALELPNLLGDTPLGLLTPSGRPSSWGCARLLLEAGADSKGGDPKREPVGASLRDGSRRGPLHVEAALNEPERLRVWVAAGAPIDAKDIDGMTALHAAARVGGAAALEALLELGAKCTVLDTGGSSALHWAAAALNPDQAVHVLIKAGADLEQRNGLGLTPLLVAAGLGRMTTVEILLRAGASWMAVDVNGAGLMDLLRMNRGVAPLDAVERLSAVIAEVEQAQLEKVLEKAGEHKPSSMRL